MSAWMRVSMAGLAATGSAGAADGIAHESATDDEGERAIEGDVSVHGCIISDKVCRIEDVSRIRIRQ
jgi:hypothetical protein